MQLLLLLEEFKDYWPKIYNEKHANSVITFVWNDRDSCYISYEDMLNSIIQQTEEAIDDLKSKRKMEGDLAGDASGRSKRSGV